MILQNELQEANARSLNAELELTSVIFRVRSIEDSTSSKFKCVDIKISQIEKSQSVNRSSLNFSPNSKSQFTSSMQDMEVKLGEVNRLAQSNRLAVKKMLSKQSLDSDAVQESLKRMTVDIDEIKFAQQAREIVAEARREQDRSSKPTRHSNQEG